MHAFHKINLLKLKLCFSLPWCNDNIFVINYIWDLRNKSCLTWCNYVHVQGILNWSKLCFTSVICISSHFFSIRNIFFNNTLRLFLNFSRIRKFKQVLIWETFCNRCTFIKFIVKFQLNKCLKRWTGSKFACSLYLRSLQCGIQKKCEDIGFNWGSWRAL